MGTLRRLCRPFVMMIRVPTRWFQSAIVWPELGIEFGDYSRYFRGNVLNAGAGGRDISPFINGHLYNQDIKGALNTQNIDFYATLHNIPIMNEFFDTIICNAVLEHVEDPSAVMQEFFRVLKPGGYLYVVVPFLQPEHLDPTDFQRYTKDGLWTLATRHGFEVLTIEGIHSVYHTLACIIQEWLTSKRTVVSLVLRIVLFPLLRYQCRHSRTYVHSIASAYRVLAQKPMKQL